MVGTSDFDPFSMLMIAFIKLFMCYIVNINISLGDFIYFWDINVALYMLKFGITICVVFKDSSPSFLYIKMRHVLARVS